MGHIEQEPSYEKLNTLHCEACRDFTDHKRVDGGSVMIQGLWECAVCKTRRPEKYSRTMDPPKRKRANAVGKLPDGKDQLRNRRKNNKKTPISKERQHWNREIMNRRKKGSAFKREN